MTSRSQHSIHHSLYDISLCFFRWLPIVSGIALTIDCLFLLMAMRPYFMALVFGTSLTDMVALMAASFTFRFCWLHRAFIFYCFAVSFCVDYQVVYGFDEWLTPLRVLMFIWGSGMMVWLFTKGLGKGLAT